MVKREDLAGKTQKEIEAMLDADIQEYIVVVSELADKDAVLAKEEELMVVMNDNDTRLKAVEYDIADSCIFDNQVFNRKTVAEYLIDFINTQEVDWNYTLGLYELVKLWKNKDLVKIQYHAYDSTLRILGQCKYKGFESWRKIMVVNTFLSTCHEEYVRDTGYMIYLTTLHNALLDALKRFDEPQPETEVKDAPIGPESIE